MKTIFIDCNDQLDAVFARVYRTDDPPIVVNTKPFEKLEIPKAVLFCTRDHSADYLGMAARLKSFRVQTADGSHEMLFSAPGAYTKALVRLVAASRG